MLKIRRASTYLRTTMFTTRHREKTDGLCVRYTHHPDDQRIDAAYIDIEHARTGRLGIGWHYVVLIDGTVETCRHPLTYAAIGGEKFARSHILIGVVGGRDKETGKFSHTLTPAQRDALEALYQKLADTLGFALEIDESLARSTLTRHEQVETVEAELNERLNRAEALSLSAY